MSTRTLIRLVVVTALVVACVAAAWADGGMASTHYRIPWSALTPGSQDMSSSGFTMQGSIACAAAQTAAGERFSLATGFWPGWQVPPEARARVYLPLVLRDR